MITEDAIQAGLDAEPADWQARLVLADHLDELGDPRAEGYRALGMLRKRPAGHTPPPKTSISWWMSRKHWAGINDLPRQKQYRKYALPDDWYGLLLVPFRSPSFAPDAIYMADGFRYSRREAEDAAALAFAKLPAARRAELLATPVEEVTR